MVAKERCLLGYIKNSLGALSQEQRYEIILAAVKGHAWVLRDIGSLSNYELTPAQRYDIVLAAVMENGHALRYASKALRNDPKIALAAVKRTKGGL